VAGAADSFLNLGWTSFIGRGGETSVSDSEAPDSTMLAALDKTSRGDSGSGISSPLAITITTRDSLYVNGPAAELKKTMECGWCLSAPSP